MMHVPVNVHSTALHTHMIASCARLQLELRAVRCMGIVRRAVGEEHVSAAGARQASLHQAWHEALVDGVGDGR